MYSYNGTLSGNKVPVIPTIQLLGKNIQVLDVNKNCFYSALSASENGPLVILPSAVKPIDIPCIETKGLKGLASSIFKLSVVFMYTDKRGIYLRYCAPNNETKKDFTLFVEWKAMGVMTPGQNNFDNFLSYIKQEMIERHFLSILSKSNKCRKAILKAIDSISFTMFERYKLGDDLWLETGYHGGWDLLRGCKIVYHNACLEQLTAKHMLT